MAITGSIYMVVVISIERSRAILSPFQKSLNWIPFLCFVISLSVFVNLPKFLEFKVRPMPYTDRYLRWQEYLLFYIYKYFIIHLY